MTDTIQSSGSLDGRTNLFTQMEQISISQTVPMFRNDVGVENKNAPGQAFDPVTEADRNCEEALRNLIEKHFPKDGIIGEEFGTVRPDADYVWVIDPIDGTRAFVAGVPLWGTLVGILYQGQPVASFACQPFIGEVFTGTNTGADIRSEWSKDKSTRSLKTRACSQLETATLMTTTPELFNIDERRCYQSIEDKVRSVRYGTDWYAYALLSSGTCDIVIESGLSSYDILPLVALIKAAGGEVTDWKGEPLASGASFTKGQVLAVGDRKLLPGLVSLLHTAVI